MPNIYKLNLTPNLFIYFLITPNELPITGQKMSGNKKRNHIVRRYNFLKNIHRGWQKFGSTNNLSDVVFMQQGIY